MCYRFWTLSGSGSVVWRQTASYLRDEPVPPDTVALVDLAECSDPSEADMVIQQYEDIIIAIERQTQD